MEWQWFAVTVFGLLNAVLGGIMKVMWAKLENNQKELANAKQHVAETYLTKQDHMRQQERIEDKLDTILEKIDRKADK